MAGYLIAEEGPLSGFIVRFEEGTEWTLGRDPDVATIVLEDPMVSRKHAICTLTSEGFLLENLSTVNPATQNGKVIVEPVLLREGDILQIGSTFFRFTEKKPAGEEKPLPEHEHPDLSSIQFVPEKETKWLLKVIAGPNAGAEFNMERASTYIVGKDASLCDIVFQDLSVSRQHASLFVDEEEHVFIEDLNSRNGVLVNGELIVGKKEITSQDLIALGTTSFLLIDREQVRETIISPPATLPAPKEEQEAKPSPAQPALPPRDWKEMVIPKKHLLLAGIFGLLVLIGFVSTISLFQTEEVAPPEKHESEQIQEVLTPFEDMQFSFNTATGKLFLVGHVLTEVEKQELLYLVRAIPFVTSIDDNIVVDEYVWQNMNALLTINPDWQGVSIHSPKPGRFVMRGYLKTLQQGQALVDYMNMNFPYLDRLDNQVVVQDNLSLQIESILTEKTLSGITFELSDGMLVLSGRVDQSNHSVFEDTVKQFKALPGVRTVKNFVIVTTTDTSRIDLSTQYKVTGYSKKDNEGYFVVINGKILTVGDILDGMTVTAVEPTEVFLEKDGLKFKINYNLQ